MPSQDYWRERSQSGCPTSGCLRNAGHVGSCKIFKSNTRSRSSYVGGPVTGRRYGSRSRIPLTKFGLPSRWG